jgi:hypothetical protein
MAPIEIPVATPLGKAVVISCCLVIAMSVLWWAGPKFGAFLSMVFGRTQRRPETTNTHMILGVVVYAFAFAPAVMAAYVGIAIGTAPPARISSTGIQGGGLECVEELSYLSWSCSWPLSLGTRQETITWSEVDRVECATRRDGTISMVKIYSKTRRIEIGSFAIHDLDNVHNLILEHSPPSAARTCQARILNCFFGSHQETDAASL